MRHIGWTSEAKLAVFILGIGLVVAGLTVLLPGNQVFGAIVLCAGVTLIAGSWLFR